MEFFHKMFWGSNIQFRMSLFLVAVTTFILTGFAVYNYHCTRSNMLSDLQASAEIITTQLSRNLADPLWNFNQAQIEDAQLTEMMEKQLFGILIRDADNGTILSGKNRNGRWQPTDIKKDISGPYIVKKAKVLKEDETLAIVETYFTPRFVKEALRRYIVSTAITLIILNLSILTTLIVTLKRILIRPILALADDLNRGAEHVTHAAKEMSSTSQSLAEGTSEQAASVEETSASLEEISTMTSTNADHASLADHFMLEVNKMIEQANHFINKLTAQMEEISTASQETSNIIKTIDGIAFQTNLLALNAAVEAARAGEVGAGFAIVAEEVRNLALRSSQAAKNTASLIQRTVDRISTGNQMVTESNQAFFQVTEKATEVGKLISEITAVSKEQSKGISQINSAITNIDHVVQQTAANAEEAAGASEVLNAEAVIVRRTVEKLVALVDNAKHIDIQPKQKEIACDKEHPF